MTDITLPTFDDLMNPLLQALRMLGGSGSIEEIYTKTVEIIGLSEEVLAQLHEDSIAQFGGTLGVREESMVLSSLGAALAPLEVVPFDARYFDGEAKEAVAFALLAHLHLEGIPGNVATATGARGRRVLGSLTP